MDLLVGVQEKKLMIENRRDAHEQRQSRLSRLKEVKDEVCCLLKDEDDPNFLETLREEHKVVRKLRADTLKEL